MRKSDVRSMDQKTRWLTRYNEVMSFIKTNKRNPSKYKLEEHDMLNWLKANRKHMNAGHSNAIGLKCLKIFLN